MRTVRVSPPHAVDDAATGRSVGCDASLPRAAILLASFAALVAAGTTAALLLNPVTGPELRRYFRDRYLRPGATIPPLPL